MKNNNRGFTLVELIVSVAILGIVALGVAGFVLAGTKTYSSVNTTVRLQYESQLVMDQIQKYAMESSYGVVWDEDAKMLYTAGDTEMYMYKCDAGKLLFAKGPIAKEPVEAGQTYKFNTMAEHIKSMTATVTGENQHASSVIITLTLELNGKSYVGSQTIALRNKPVYADNWDALWTLTHPVA